MPLNRTAKLFIGGAFPRSESGRTYEVKSPEGKFIANAAQGSRKDARDAVTAARAIQPKWAGATAYNRGQILYRIAEMMEGRRAQFIDEVSPWAKSAKKAEAEVDEAIDRWIWFAGWSDKIAMVVGSSNPVAGPFFNFSVPEPTGVVAAIAPSRPSLLGLVDTIAPIIVSGNTTVVIASQDAPMAAVT
ncbi:MAG: aldehyde dehydrogenase family protein, partial [Actinobacteria bacterium]|nr:aldehyde dehydrogenase family protein [Actinomycetota bacterium]